MNRYLIALLPPIACLIGALDCKTTPPEPEPAIHECDTVTLGQLTVSDTRPYVHVGDTLFLLAARECCPRADEGDTLMLTPAGGTLYFYRLRHALSANEQNTAPATADFTICAITGTVSTEPECGMYADTSYCIRLNSMLRHFAPTGCSTDDTARICIAVIPLDTGTFALSYHHQGFAVASFHRDLYAPFGDTTTFSFYSEVRFSVAWAPIDERLYFFRVES